MEHSKTPWRIHPKGVIVEAQWSSVCTSTNVNMSRIVACVNACEGIPTEAIEGRHINDIFTELTLEKNRLEAQNARLLEALKSVVRYKNSPPKGWSDTWEKVSTAIAEAEKTPTP